MKSLHFGKIPSNWVDNPVMSEAEFKLRNKMADYFAMFGFYDEFDLIKLKEYKNGNGF